MSTDTTLSIESTSLENTLSIAAQVGEALKGEEVIELLGDVGAGKTVFVRGLAQGIGSSNVVQSPTFTISRIYRSEGSKGFELHHFDFYRIGDDPGVVANELKESIEDNNAAVVIEWAESVENVLPKDRLVLKIHSPTSKTRGLEFLAGINHKHLLEGLA